MNILYICSDSSTERNSVIWRCEIPNRAINSVPGHEARNRWIADWVLGKLDDDCKWADAIIVQRNLISGALVAACRWLGREKRVFVDLDDSYEHIPQTVISAVFWKNKRNIRPDGTQEDLRLDPIQHLVWGMKLLTGVTTPSEVIVQDRLAVTDASYLVPNYPDTAPYIEAFEKKKQGDKLVIGWAGGGSHVHSFYESGVMAALARVAEARKNVEILLLGPHEVYEKLGTRKKKWLPWVQFEEYPALLSKLDIAVAPLAGPYDLRRSWIKGIEYSLMNIPWIGSDYGTRYQPYSQWPHRLVKNQAKFWESRLLDIVDHFEERKREQKAEQEFAASQDAKLHVSDIIAVYEKERN